MQAAWRAVQAVDQIVARAGGNGLRMDNPLQRFWRDVNAGAGHSGLQFPSAATALVRESRAIDAP